MRIIDCPQLSESWWRARQGIPTASNFGRIITPAKRQYAASARSYIYELIAERVDLNPPWVGGRGMVHNAAMQHGIDTEPEARRAYSMLRDCDVRQVGFCVTDDGRFGCSPDGLVGERGSLELKCPALKTQVEYLDKGVLPPEYAGQVHGQLIVTGCDWVDFMSYAPGLPPLLLRVEPSDFTDCLRECLEQFNDEYLEMLRKFGLANEAGPIPPPSTKDWQEPAANPAR